MRDVLLTGKACEAVRRKDRTGACTYDDVVMDAPPTGRITRFLNVNDEVAGLARIGPIHNQAQAVMRVLQVAGDGGAPGDAAGGDAGAGDRRRHRRTARRRSCRSGDVIVNMVRPAVLDGPAGADGVAATVARQVCQGGLARRPASSGLAERLVDPLLAQAARARRAGRAGARAAGRAGGAGAADVRTADCSARAWTWPGSTDWRRTAEAMRHDPGWPKNLTADDSDSR